MTGNRDNPDRDNLLDRNNLLDRAIDAVLRAPIPDEPPPDRVASLLAAVERAAGEPDCITFRERIKTMRFRAQIAVAAIVLIVVLGLLPRLIPGAGGAVAFADVAETLTKVRSATWKSQWKYKGPGNQVRPVSMIGMFLAPSHERMEITADGEANVTIIDGEKNKMISLDPTAKIATVIDVRNAPSEGPYGRTFQGLQEIVAAAQRGEGGKVERLDGEEIDGRRTECFRIRRGSIEIKVWADPKTFLPVRVEENAGNPETRIVMTDFQVDKDLDESLFSLDVPAGYTVEQTMQVDATKKPITYVAEALKMAAEFNDGVFPAELRGEQGIDGITRQGMIAWEKEHANDPPEQKRAKVRNLAMTMGGAFGVILSLPSDSVHYAGKDVKLNTADRPIFWCPAIGKDKTGYQVIYADLTVREMSAEEAAKLLPSEQDE
jgi:outer membrane lipoprotein-sorting protein